MRSLMFLCLLLSVVAVACAGEAPPAHEAGSPEPSAPQSSPAPPSPPAAPADFGPVSSRGDRVTAPVGEPEASGGGLVVDLPEGWVAETPDTSMRMLQARIPGSAGDGILAAFFFGVGRGGGVEANLQRWVDQVVPDAGQEPQRDSFEANGLLVTWVEVAGTLKANQMGGPTTDQPGSRLLGAVVQGPGGPWFFKATGPDATMTEGREAFLQLLQGLRVGG